MNFYKALLLLCLVFFMQTPFALASANEENKTVLTGTYDDVVIPKKLQKEIKSEIIKIYGKKNADVIYEKVYKIAETAKNKRPDEFLKEDINRRDDWYKDEIIYTFYADSFGVKDEKEANKFNDTLKMLDYLSDLGVTTLHILPFQESPMDDSGFDVKNPKNVRYDLGGNEQFKNFIKEAKKRNFKIMTDLVLNHFSDRHEWFKELMEGDLDKLNYFISREKMPEYKKYKDENLGYVVEYKEDSGKISKRRLIFPEMSENHYRKITVKGKDYYIYHTFYPFQPDINWENPEVLYYNLETINFWANLGVDIFRMDAIPYLSKEEGTNAENRPQTHSIVKLLSAYIQAVSPKTVIQAEACETPKEILPYFGNERKIEIQNKTDKKEIKRTDEVQIAYHFPYMPYLWASFITKDSNYFKEINNKTPEIPNSAAWAVFLRVHDELTLEMIDPVTREIIYNSLVGKGVEFRKGYGVSGRMANFLDNSPNRIGMAFSTLFSIKGIPIIYYGDEIGIRNNYSNAIQTAKKREIKQKKNKIKLLSYFDSRDINRGKVTSKMFYGSVKDYYAFNSRIYKKVKRLIKIRKELPEITRGSFTILKTNDNSILAYMRKLKDEKLIIVENLSSKKQTAEIELPLDIVLTNGKNRVKFIDLVDDNVMDLKIHIPKKIIINLKPYDYLWLKPVKKNQKQGV